MTIKYIKSLIDDKIIYKFSDNRKNIINYTQLYNPLNPFNPITETDDDYYNHLNNILKSGIYVIRPIITKSNNDYILLIDKCIFGINRDQLIILDSQVQGG